MKTLNILIVEGNIEEDSKIFIKAAGKKVSDNLKGLILNFEPSTNVEIIHPGNLDENSRALDKIKTDEDIILLSKGHGCLSIYSMLTIQGYIDVNELKMIGLGNRINVDENIPVLLEKIEDKNGEVVVSALKAQKIEGWYKLEKAYENNESILGKITSKCKGGVIVEHVETGSLMFCPGSQISDKPLSLIHI